MISGVYDELKRIVRNLAEAQKRTEIKFQTLIERVDDLTQRMLKLTENVSPLERKVEDMVGEMKRMTVTIQDIKQEMGGLSHAIGYGLEDRSYLTLPPILNRDHSITLKSRLKRGFLETSHNQYIEINIWGQGECDRKLIEIIGEVKTQLKKKDVVKFLQTIQAVQSRIDHSIYPVFKSIGTKYLI